MPIRGVHKDSAREAINGLNVSKALAENERDPALVCVGLDVSEKSGGYPKGDAYTVHDGQKVMFYGKENSMSTAEALQVLNFFLNRGKYNVPGLAPPGFSADVLPPHVMAYPKECLPGSNIRLGIYVFRPMASAGERLQVTPHHERNPTGMTFREIFNIAAEYDLTNIVMLCCQQRSECVALARPMKKLQVSFMNEDFKEIALYRDVVDRKVDDWEMCPFINGAVRDSDWFPRWGGELDGAGGALIQFTKTYRDKCEADPRTACLKEAECILDRLRRDPGFRVFVLDPAKADQGPGQLRCLLEDDEPCMNVEGWKKFIEKVTTKEQSTPKSPAPAPSPSGAVSSPLEQASLSVSCISAVSEEYANDLEYQLQKMAKLWARNDLETYFPSVVFSYATGTRPDIDDPGAGPGLVAVARIQTICFDEGIPTYSGLTLPVGQDWEVFKLRIAHRGKAKAKVLVALLSKAFYQSTACLDEVHRAVEYHVPVIPVRLEKDLPEPEDQWSQFGGGSDMMVKVEKAQEALGKNSIPPAPRGAFQIPKDESRQTKNMNELLQELRKYL